jgi:hypothetical protein
MRGAIILIIYELTALGITALGIRWLFLAGWPRIDKTTRVNQRLVWLIKALLAAVCIVAGLIFAAFYIPAAIALNGGLW